MENILPSAGLCPGTRISFLASVHSKELFLPSFFSPKKCVDFLNFSLCLCLKLDSRFPYL